jgi:hypothetical protein
LININAYAEMTEGLNLPTTMIPVGTGVTAELSFNVSSGTRSTASFTDVSGEFSWTDAAMGRLTFNAASATITTTHSAGWLNLQFSGTGPTVNGITAQNFSLRLDIGVNPFTTPGSSTELYDLLADSSVTRLRFGASQAGLTQYSDIETNVTGNVTAGSSSHSVPELDANSLPISLAFIVTLLGFYREFKARELKAK